MVWADMSQRCLNVVQIKCKTWKKQAWKSQKKPRTSGVVEANKRISLSNEYEEKQIKWRSWYQRRP
jgi:hypothetical protein